MGNKSITEELNEVYSAEILKSEAENSQTIKAKFDYERLKSKIQDREERKKFATRIFWVIIAYIAIVFVVLFFCGYSCMHFSDAVLITLLSTTTANVLSLLAIVFNYLFPKKIKY